jgi:hypothetical protein
MNPDILQRLKSLDYHVACLGLEDLLKGSPISENDLLELFSIDNTLIISDFLERYNNFHSIELKLVEEYINNNLDHSDSIFVSDLIEFSTYWGLSIPYEKCLSFLERWGDDDDYLALSSIDYILENLRYSYIDEIYKLLYSILHNPESNQSTQVKSAFALLRITGRKVFLTDLIDLVVNGNANNKLLLNNILSLKYNSSLYFDYYDILKSMMPYPESNKNIIDPIE